MTDYCTYDIRPAAGYRSDETDRCIAGLVKDKEWVDDYCLDWHQYHDGEYSMGGFIDYDDVCDNLTELILRSGLAEIPFEVDCVDRELPYEEAPTRVFLWRGEQREPGCVVQTIWPEFSESLFKDKGTEDIT